MDLGPDRGVDLVAESDGPVGVELGGGPVEEGVEPVGAHPGVVPLDVVSHQLGVEPPFGRSLPVKTGSGSRFESSKGVMVPMPLARHLGSMPPPSCFVPVSCSGKRANVRSAFRSALVLRNDEQRRRTTSKVGSPKTLLPQPY